MKKSRRFLSIGVAGMALFGLLPLIASCVGPRLSGGAAVKGLSEPAQFTGPTPVIDSDNREIVRLAQDLTRGLGTDREKAVRIHNFVRDEIRFGWQSRFYEVRASEVLAARVGYCNTKSTLFIAMLRASGIPARQHFVDLNAGLLTGLVNPGTPYVDHSYTEVWLGGRWVRTDSYIVDPPLHAAAVRRLQTEGGVYGYGVHREGTIEWDGERDAFSQFVVQPGDPGFTRSDFGVHADVVAFYRDTPAAWNRLSPPVRLLGGVFFSSASNAADRLRADATTAAPTGPEAPGVTRQQRQ